VSYVLYPADDFADRQRIASLLGRRPTFGERLFYWIG
jgi:hypothetical protein